MGSHQIMQDPHIACAEGGGGGGGYRVQDIGVYRQ